MSTPDGDAKSKAGAERSVPTAELLQQANEQLVFAKMRAEAATAEAQAAKEAAQEDRAALEAEAELREQLMGVVGHDLRNPLASILMSARLLLRANKYDPRTTEILMGIENSAGRMRDLIEHLLEFTRAHSGGGLSVRPEPTDLGKLCRTVVRELEVGRNAQGRFVVESSGELTGHWDPARLEQVVSNVAANALDHGSRDGAISVRASATPEQVTLEINNSGDPIPQDLIADIFHPFSRRKRTAEDERTGSMGLGLYIAHELVRAHHGTIDVRSTAADGTTFRIVLPRRPPTQPFVSKKST